MNILVVVTIVDHLHVILVNTFIVFPVARQIIAVMLAVAAPLTVIKIFATSVLQANTNLQFQLTHALIVLLVVTLAKLVLALALFAQKVNILQVEHQFVLIAQQANILRKLGAQNASIVLIHLVLIASLAPTLRQ
jgi:hypothetical protein